MFPKFANKRILVGVRGGQLVLQILIKLREFFPIFDHNVDGLVLELFRSLQLGGVLCQDTDAVLRIFIIVIGSINAAAHQPKDDDQEVYFKHSFKPPTSWSLAVRHRQRRPYSRF